jgi:hypothetical protein
MHADEHPAILLALVSRKVGGLTWHYYCVTRKIAQDPWCSHAQHIVCQQVPDGAIGHRFGLYNQVDVGNGVDSSLEKHKSYSVGGSYIVDLVRLNAGYFHYTAE